MVVLCCGEVSVFISADRLSLLWPYDCSKGPRATFDLLSGMLREGRVLAKLPCRVIDTAQASLMRRIRADAAHQL